MSKVKFIVIIIAAALILIASSFGAGYLKGWYAHADHINAQAAAKKKQAEIKQASSAAKSQQVRVVTETKYQTIYRDVVKYVSDPNRNQCNFDDNYIRLRQLSLDADSAISRDARQGVRIVEKSTEKH